jgi:hypothetical protein
VPFVSNDVLQQLLIEFGKFQQRLDDQQEAIRQLAQTNSAAVAANLNETRDIVSTELAAVRDTLRGFDRTNGDAAAGHLSEARDVARRALAEQRDLNAANLVATVAAIRDDIKHLNRPAQEAPAGAVSAPTVAPEAPEADEGHSDLLRAAAGISAATLNVHRDTWAFLVEHAGQDRHFHIPGEVIAEGGTVRVDVSGPSLVAALITLRAVHTAPAAAPGTAAIARQLYDRIAGTVNAATEPAAVGSEPEPEPTADSEPAGVEPDGQPEPAPAETADPTEPEDADWAPGDQA